MSAKKKAKKKVPAKKAPVRKPSQTKIVKKASNTVAATGPVKPFKTYGITRVDQPEKSNHGYYVRVAGVQKWFSDIKHGSRKKALAAAIDKRDALFITLPKHRQLRAAKKHVYSAASL